MEPEEGPLGGRCRSGSVPLEKHNTWPWRIAGARRGRHEYEEEEPPPVLADERTDGLEGVRHGRNKRVMTWPASDYGKSLGCATWRMGIRSL